MKKYAGYTDFIVGIDREWIISEFYVGRIKLKN
jgi:hypothetical protein